MLGLWLVLGLRDVQIVYMKTLARTIHYMCTKTCIDALVAQGTDKQKL